MNDTEENPYKVKCQEAVNKSLPACCFGSVRNPLALIQEVRGEACFSWGWGIQAFLITVISTLFLLMKRWLSATLSLIGIILCKSGILIFIFAGNNYSIYAHAMLIKTPLLHQRLGPRVCLSVFLSFFLSFILSFFLSILSVFLSVSLYFWLIPWSVEARWAHFLARASKTHSRRCTVPSPTREGAWCLRAAAQALRTGLYWLSA